MTKLSPNWFLDHVSESAQPLASYLADLHSVNSQSAAQRSLQMSVSAIRKRMTIIEFDWRKLRRATVTEMLRGLLAQDKSPASINLARAHLIGVAKQCRRLGYLTPDELLDIREVKRQTADVNEVGRALTVDEITCLLAACGNQERPLTAMRDKAMVAVLIAGGLRRSECAGLTASDIDIEKERLTVRGKGRKKRTVYLWTGAIAHIQPWLEFRQRGALFPSFLANGEKIRNQRVTDRGIADILTRVRLLAGVEPFTPHDLRRTHLTLMIEQTGDLRAAQQQAGHSSIETTIRYDKSGARAQQSAARKMKI